MPGEWLRGDITLCTHNTQGVFINLCCYYWMKDCSICLANAKQRFSKDVASLEELLKQDIISLDENENIVIKFLDEQMSEFIDISEKRAISGSIGGKANAKQMLSKRVAKRSNIDKEKDIDKDKDKDNNYIEFEIFWNDYNKKLGDKKKCVIKWNKLTPEIQLKIIESLPEWKKQFRDNQFQPYPETYLNQERWNDEILRPKIKLAI